MWMGRRAGILVSIGPLFSQGICIKDSVLLFETSQYGGAVGVVIWWVHRRAGWDICEEGGDVGGGLRSVEKSGVGGTKDDGAIVGVLNDWNEVLPEIPLLNHQKCTLSARSLRRRLPCLFWRVVCPADSSAKTPRAMNLLFIVVGGLEE